MADKNNIEDTHKIEPEKAVDFHLRSAWLGVSRMYNEIALTHGMTMSMAFILINISKKGTNPTKLGPKMGMQANSLSRSLKSLEEKGLITRKRAKEDKREVRIFLTKKGLEGRKVSNHIIATFNEYLYADITGEELDMFLSVIEKVHKGIEAMRHKIGL